MAKQLVNFLKGLTLRPEPYRGPTPLRVPIEPDLKTEKKPDTVKSRNVEVIESYSSKNVLCQLLSAAYYQHLIPIIKPDDIYLQILSILAKHVNKSPAMVDHYRPFLADPSDPNNKTVIVIRRGDDFDLNNQDHVGSVFNELMIKVCEKSSGSNLLTEMKADFTTTTDITSLVSQVTLASMVKEFFAMRCIALCGWRAVDLAGSIEDWMSIKKKINAFEQIAHPSIKEYLRKCHSSLDIIIKAFKGQVDVQVWKNCFVSKHCGSGSTEWSGFLTEFFNPTRNWSPADQASSRVVYDFGMSDHQGDRNVSIDAGPVGVKYHSDGTLSMAYDFFIEPSKAKGFTVIEPEGPRSVQFFSELDFAQGPAYYSRVRFEDQPLHFYVTNNKSFGIVYHKPTKAMFLVSKARTGSTSVRLIEDFIAGQIVTSWSVDICLSFQATKILGMNSQDEPDHIKKVPFVEQDWFILYQKV